MTTIPLPSAGPVRDTIEARPERDNYLTHTRGVLSWVFTLDHKRIGVMYLWSVLGSFLLGGIFALLVRTELLTPARRSPRAPTPTTSGSPSTGRSWCSW